MSLTTVLPYFRTRLETLNFTQWRDAFDHENIPETILDRVYHLTVGLIDPDNANQHVHNFNFSVVVRVFFKGVTQDDSVDTRDDVIVELELILAEVLKASNRLSAGIKNIVPGNIDIKGTSDSNTNDMVLEMNFTAQLMCVFN